MGTGGGSGSNTVWYRFVATSAGGVRANTFGSGYDTVLAAFTGSRDELARVAGNDDAHSSTSQSEIAFQVQTGTTYYLEIAQYGSAGGGTLQLSVEYGNPATPTATPVPTAGPILSLIPTSTAAPSAVPIGTFTGWYRPTRVPGLVVTPGPPPSHDDIGSAITIEALPFTSTADTTGATGVLDDPEMGSLGSNSNTVWYRLLAPLSGSVRASTMGSSYDTVLAAFIGSRGNLTMVASNDDMPPAVQSEISFNVLAGTTYYLEVAQFGTPAGGDLNFRVEWIGSLPTATPTGTPSIFGTSGVLGTPGTSGTPGILGVQGTPGTPGIKNPLTTVGGISTGALGPIPAPIRVAGPVQRDARYFQFTGYRINLDPFWDYFNKRGGVATFGYPISWEFTLMGFHVQFFQRGILQLMPGGGVASMNLLDEGLMPYTRINSSSFPAPEQDLIEMAPSPFDPDYGGKALAFLQANVPDEWEGLPVRFLRSYLATVRYQDAFPDGTGDASLLPLMSLELWGLPTSRPRRDPNNGSFVYQRFQRGIMHYDAGTGATQGLLLADFLKSIITGRGLPADLEQQAASSRFYRQYEPRNAGYLARPIQLPGSNMEGAFESLLPQPTVAPAPPMGQKSTPAAAPGAGAAGAAGATPTAQATAAHDEAEE